MIRVHLTKAPLARRALGAAAGLVLDQVVGEPPVPGGLHPVALFGAAAGHLERRVYASGSPTLVARGALYAAAGAGAATGAGWVLRSPVVAGYLATSGRALHQAARHVAEALDRHDLDQARARLPALVGRDPSALDSGEVARAAVESVAENTTDAIVAPALWTATAGAPGAFLHRAADTLDSMVGYHNPRYEGFGRASARLDDALAWLPARITAALVALVRPRRAGAILTAVRRDASGHPSPNAGVAEASFAAALEVQLGGVNRYGDLVEDRARLGDGRPVEPDDICAAVRLSRDVTWALVGLLVTAAGVTR
jgi:adenosylcobinamide-phosphate synthase